MSSRSEEEGVALRVALMLRPMEFDVKVPKRWKSKVPFRPTKVRVPQGKVTWGTVVEVEFCSGIGRTHTTSHTVSTLVEAVRCGAYKRWWWKPVWRVIEPLLGDGDGHDTT